MSARASAHQGAYGESLTIAGVDVHAISVGGLETCIELPKWSLAFDIGRCPPSAIHHKRILFTHPHIDHMGGVAHHCGLRDLWGLPPPTYLVPEECHPDFLALLEVWRRLDRSTLPCTVVPMRPGQSWEISKGRVVRAFRAVHRVPSLGYALLRTKSRLLPALRGLSEDEIVARRRAGEEVTEAVEEIEAAFCGDTTIDVLRHELVRKAKLLILECTFPGPEVSVERARRSGHVHLDELLERIGELENERILLTHFSTRYSPRRIREILDARLPADQRERFVALLPGPPWQPAERDEA